MPESSLLPSPHQMLPCRDGATIAYHKSAGYTPGVVFIHGLVSDMTGEKAVALERWCQAQGRAFVRFDCFGHGRSSGDFCAGTVGRWVEDTIAVLDALTEGPQVLVGSSIGGWIALITALECGTGRVVGIVGSAVAADFTEDIWQRLSFAEWDELMRQGVISLPNAYGGDPYRISRKLIEEGRRHLLLRGPIAVMCPVRLIHGLADPDVPWQTALLLQERIVSPDVVVTLVKDGGHRLSRPQDLERLGRVVAALIAIL